MSKPDDQHCPACGFLMEDSELTDAGTEAFQCGGCGRWWERELDRSGVLRPADEALVSKPPDLAAQLAAATQRAERAERALIRLSDAVMDHGEEWDGHNLFRLNAEMRAESWYGAMALADAPGEWEG